MVNCFFLWPLKFKFQNISENTWGYVSGIPRQEPLAQMLYSYRCFCLFVCFFFFYAESKDGDENLILKNIRRGMTFESTLNFNSCYTFFFSVTRSWIVSKLFIHPYVKTVEDVQIVCQIEAILDLPFLVLIFTCIIYCVTICNSIWCILYIKCIHIKRILFLFQSLWVHPYQKNPITTLSKYIGRFIFQVIKFHII